MTLRIREMVIHAEIGGDGDPVAARRERTPRPEPAPSPKTESLTQLFYQESSLNDNER